MDRPSRRGLEGGIRVVAVSYGGVSAGTRAVQALKQVVTALRMYPVTDAVSIPFFSQFINILGQLEANETMEGAATTMLDELLNLAKALQPLREREAVTA